ncbi:MAG: hypothetical protein IKX28_01625 [Bacteroidales bacterium]|nr:hypothetical protein [Bacteroidales bacterium]
MKKLLFLAFALLCSLGLASAQIHISYPSGTSTDTMSQVHPGMKYKEYKQFYNPRFYVPEVGDDNPAWIGVASFFVPGLGQAITGHWGRAAAFFGGEVAISMLILSQCYQEVSYTKGTVTYGMTKYAIPLIIADAALVIWNVVDAVRVAKITNMYYQDLRRQRNGLALNLDPYFTLMPDSTPGTLRPTAGLSLRLSF